MIAVREARPKNFCARHQGRTDDFFFLLFPTKISLAGQSVLISKEAALRKYLT